jgi:hypothetical protein
MKSLRKLFQSKNIIRKETQDDFDGKASQSTCVNCKGMLRWWMADGRKKNANNQRRKK